MRREPTLVQPLAHLQAALEDEPLDLVLEQGRQRVLLQHRELGLGARLIEKIVHASPPDCRQFRPPSLCAYARARQSLRERIEVRNKSSTVDDLKHSAHDPLAPST